TPPPRVATEGHPYSCCSTVDYNCRGGPPWPPVLPNHKPANLFVRDAHPRHGQSTRSPACKSIRVLLNLVNGMPPIWEKYHEENISTSALHFAAGFDLNTNARRHHSSQGRQCYSRPGDRF